MSNLTQAIKALKTNQINIPTTTNQNNSSKISSPQTTLSPREKLCALIQTERHLQKLTQRQLAQKSRYSQGSITRLEKHGQVSLGCALEIINALGKRITLTNK